MKNKIFLWFALVWICVSLQATSVENLLPKPQQVTVTGGSFTIGKVSLETPVLQSAWEEFIVSVGGEIV